MTPGHGRDLAVLTGAKTVSNTALRWIGVFLPTLERAFGTSTGTLTSIMGVAELGGLLSTTWLGHPPLRAPRWRSHGRRSTTPRPVAGSTP